MTGYPDRVHLEKVDMKTGRRLANTWDPVRRHFLCRRKTALPVSESLHKHRLDLIWAQGTIPGHLVKHSSISPLLNQKKVIYFQGRAAIKRKAECQKFQLLAAVKQERVRSLDKSIFTIPNDHELGWRSFWARDVAIIIKTLQVLSSENNSFKVEWSSGMLLLGVFTEWNCWKSTSCCQTSSQSASWSDTERMISYRLCKFSVKPSEDAF